jgi:signal transduction histidine kinase
MPSYRGIAHFKYAVSTNLCRFGSKAAFLKKIIFTLLFFLITSLARSQAFVETFLPNADTIDNITPIPEFSSVFIDSNLNLPVQKIPDQQFISFTKFTSRDDIPAKWIGKKFYIRFSIQNNSNNLVRYYYYPGKLFRKLQLFRVDPEGSPLALNTKGLMTGFIPVNLPPNTISSFMLEAVFFKTTLNQLRSILIPPQHLETFENQMYKSLSEKKIIGMLLSGMLLMMILVTLLNYFVTYKDEFLYNSLYSLCMFFLIFLTTYLSGRPGWFRGLFLSYLDLFLLIAGTIFYLAFTRCFLNTKNLHPRLNNFLYIEAWVLGILMLCYTVLHLAFNYYDYEIVFENVLKILALAAGVVYIYLSYREKNPLMNYLAVGAAAQVFFFVISLVLNVFQVDSTSIYTSPFFYFELGVICSLIFFLLGLFYKNRSELTLKIQEQEAMKLEAEKQFFETQLSIYKVQEEERNRISADMHDDLGAGMTSIRLYSELAKSKSGENILPEIEKISSSADELINNMNAIIWSMSSHNDTLGNMVAYIRSYCIDYFENTNIQPIITIPENIPALFVNGSIRRNVFLVVKEALQNIIKHAKATQVKIILSQETDGLSLVIHDNGRGIDLDNIRQFSNGLKNMKKRMQDVEIDFAIANDNGTKIRLFRKTR